MLYKLYGINNTYNINIGRKNKECKKNHVRNILKIIQCVPKDVSAYNISIFYVVFYYSHINKELLYTISY